LAAFSVGQKPVEAAGYVPQVECDRRDARGAGVQLFVTEIPAPALQVFLGQFQGVQDGTLYWRHIS
jgi:hypothetical protein